MVVFNPLSVIVLATQLHCCHTQHTLLIITIAHTDTDVSSNSLPRPQRAKILTTSGKLRRSKSGENGKIYRSKSTDDLV